MKKIKMTGNVKEKGLRAGLIYELADKDAERYLDLDIAIEIKQDQPKKGKVSYGNR